MKHNREIKQFRRHIEQSYQNCPFSYKGGFDEMLCYELHSQPINPRMRIKTGNDGFETGLTFKELAQKWGISISFLGELISDHCKRLENVSPTRIPDEDEFIWHDAKTREVVNERIR